MMQPFRTRAIDIVLSALGLLVTMPAMLVLCVLGYFLNGSPLFFQTRVGKQQKAFTLVKLRTMKLNTESVGTHLVDSDSITPYGTFLRRSKLDELPQLFNVLLGQMSLVGPRPCLPNQAELIAERDKRNVFGVRPGITGLGQISNVDMSTPRKLARYDKLMINRLDLKLYLLILVATALGKGHGDRIIPRPRQATDFSEIHAR